MCNLNKLNHLGAGSSMELYLKHTHIHTRSHIHIHIRVDTLRVNSNFRTLADLENSNNGIVFLNTHKNILKIL